MIRSIQDETRKAVETMEMGTKQVEDGVKAASEAGSALQHIIEMASQVDGMVTHIATAAAEQSKASEHINASVDQISSIASETADGARQSAKGCETVSQLVIELEQLIGIFKLAQQNHGRNRPALPAPSKPAAMAAAAGYGFGTSGQPTLIR